MNDTTVAAVIFVTVYSLLAVERFPRTGVALLGGLLVVIVGILDQEDAFGRIDLNVIFLLVGMMIIANALSRTGAFQYVAIKAAKLGDARPLRILILLSALTAVTSAFLDNVTTVVLVAPVTFIVAALLNVRPVPFLISEVLASNIGGSATLIGDPPNIVIGSHAGLGFIDFLVHMLPIAVLALVAYLLLALFLWRKDLADPPRELKQRLFNVKEAELITDPTLLKISLAVLAATLAGFPLAQVFGYEPATVALAGAAVLLLVGRVEAHELLAEVEWTTILFFVGLFIVVGGVEEVGLLEEIGERLAGFSSGNALGASMIILWMSGIASGIVDNIPYTAAMLPVVDQVQRSLGQQDDALWWALAMGADMGGNLTIIAASANVLVSGLAKRAGYQIAFWEFARYGAAVTLFSLCLSTAYVWLRYFAS